MMKITITFVSALGNLFLAYKRIVSDINNKAMITAAAKKDIRVGPALIKLSD